MKWIYNGLLVLIGVFISFCTYSQETKSDTLKLSLTDAQNYAIQYNRSVQSAKIDVESAKKKVWETTAIGLPQASLSANYQHIFKVPEFSLPMVGLSATPLPLIDGLQQRETSPGSGVWQYYMEGEKLSMAVQDNTTFDLTVSQLIFSGEYIVGLQASKVFKELSEKSLAKVENQTMENVANSYYMIKVVDENISVLSQSLEVMDKTYNDLAKMNEVGFNEETDVDQIKINKTNIEILINSLNAQKEILTKLLKLQLGLDYSQQLVLTEKLSDVIEKCNLGFIGTQEFNVENTVDMQLINTQVKLSELSLKREKSTFLPTISGFYKHQEQLNEPSFSFAMKDIAGISLSLPIFSSGMKMAKVSQAKLSLKQSQLNKTNVEQSLVMEYDQAKSDYLTAFSSYNMNKESMELSKKIYDKTIIKYTEGVASSFELTQNQGQYLTAQSNYFNSMLQLLQSKAKLDRILKKYGNQ
ncbi:MAG TPA: TolC family protein [Tenuifilaceae bacterium]|nr:TolC family protein [Tenuifilaceae bacterium]HPI43732.1 TolC family protein [Tenuifilaceae bacterium]HPN20509.1 TolC family protein [Tenuifilaceae bacterium]